MQQLSGFPRLACIELSIGLHKEQSMPPRHKELVQIAESVLRAKRDVEGEKYVVLKFADGKTVNISVSDDNM